MPKKPTSADAQLVLQLYDFRREAEMRKARTWFANFWPASANEILEVVNNFGTPENAWFRQVTGYWDMAAALVLSGAMNEELFTDTNGEMWFVFSNLHPFLAEARKTSKLSQLLLRVEKMAKKSKIGRELLSTMEKRFGRRREAAAGKSS